MRSDEGGLITDSVCSSVSFAGIVMLRGTARDVTAVGAAGAQMSDSFGPLVNSIARNVACFADDPILTHGAGSRSS